jgi:hypothetical protein
VEATRAERIRQFFRELGVRLRQPVQLYVDCQATFSQPELRTQAEHNWYILTVQTLPLA